MNDNLANHLNDHRVDRESEIIETPGLLGVIQQVSHLAFFGNGVSVIQGEKGCGKSTIVELLQTRFEDANYLACLKPVFDQNVLETISTICNGFGIGTTEAGNVGELISELRGFSQALINDGKLGVLLIDDAERLDDQALGAILSLLVEDATGAGLHVIFTADSSLAPRLDALQVDNVVVYDFDVPHMSPAEVSSLLESVSGEEPDASLVKSIWTQSRGLPGIAIDLFRNDLNSSVPNGRKSKPEESRSIGGLPFIHIAALAVLLVVLVVAMTGGDGSEIAIKTEKVAIPAKNQNDKGAAAPKVRAMADTNAEKLTVSSSPIPSTSPTITPSKAEREAAKPKSNGVDERPLLVESSPKPASTPKVMAEKQNMPSKNEAKQQLAAQGQLKNQQVEQAAPAGTAETVIPEGVARKDEASSESVLASTYINDEVFLLKQPSSAYTLQVISSGGRKDLLKYLERQSNRSKLFLYKTVRNGKPWYVVVHGVYNTRSEALSAKLSLPADQKKLGAWPRKFSSIHSEIR